MASQRPKSLNELNNVYDKAMRAERAIKEGSDLLTIHGPEPAPKTENIFDQLESKAAEAQKNQIFDQEITNIANDFLKRYAQPEKPKAAPQEIKRPAPSIQVYHTPAKVQSKPETAPLNTGSNFADIVKPQSAPVHKPAPVMPATEPVRREVSAPAVVPAQTPVRETAPAVNVPASTGRALTKTKAQPVVDHTPRPTPTRVRITSSARSELMDEYMRVMSDEDDEPTEKKSKFSFFKKRKKYEEPEEDMAETLYEEASEETAEEDPAEEVPVVPFDDSNVKYEDEYSGAPEEEFAEEDNAEESEDVPMNLYDYIEADFDYDEDEDDALDMSFTEDNSAAYEPLSDNEEECAEESAVTSEETEEAYEEYVEESVAEEYIQEEAETVEYTEETEEYVPYEAEEDAVVYEETEEEIPVAEEPETEIEEDTDMLSDFAEDDFIPEETEDAIYPEEEAEETVTYAEEEVYDYAPPADMVFEDIFSVTDESKRSHTGGNWSEVFGEEYADEDSYEEVVAEVYEEATEEISEESYEEDVQYEQETYEAEEDVYAEISEDMPAEEVMAPVEEIPQETAETETEAPQEDIYETFIKEAEEEFYNPPKRTLLKVVMALVAVFCLAGAALSVFLTAVIGVDSGKLFSDKFRVFSVSVTTESAGLEKGDLVIAENIFAHTDEVIVYENQDNGAYSFGKVTANSTNLAGDYLYVTQTEDGSQLINRDLSLGVVRKTYGGIGGLMSAICNYGIILALVLIILAAASIAGLAYIIIKQRRYYEAAAIYDNMDNFGDDDDSDNSADGNDDDNEYYSDYDTDGIEEGLFNGI